MNHSLYRYKKRMLILCIMLAVVLMITGVSYAVFTNYSSQTDANTLAASCMDLEFNGQNEINLLNTYPISEGEALEQTPYTFTIKNKCDNYIEYYVIASVISTTNKVDSKYVKVSLLGDNDLNGTVINTLESISTPQSLSKYNITENYILKRGDGITKDESRTFNFRMWLDSSNKDIWTREDIEGKDYQVKISVVGTVKTRPKDDLYVAALIDGVESSTFPTTDKYTASVECTRNGKKIDAKESIDWSGTEWELTTKITSGNVRCNANFETPALKETILTKNELKAPITTPGAAVSTVSEALLASTEDDNGTSYYFRGAVKNNYVEFANMCWRIVRVTGNAGIKLVLYNYNGLSNTNTVRSSSSPCNVTGSNLSYMRLDNNLYFEFNEEGTDNAYEGLMYGSPNSSSYAATHANVNVSTIVASLNTWYKNVLLKQNNFKEDYLVDTIWCNDKNVITDTTYDPWDVGYNDNFGFGGNMNYYKTTQRLYNRVNNMVISTPSFVCPNDNNGGKLSKFTVDDTTNGNGNLTYKIGLLTVDEVAFSGSAFAIYNFSTYLLENVGDDIAWWTLSPYYFRSNAYVYHMVAGQLYNFEVSESFYFGLRPAISLVSDITISGGTGTSEDPYVVD